MGNDLRPYYDPESFDAGYSVSYRPGIGVLYPNSKSLANSIFSSDGGPTSNISGSGLSVRNTSLFNSGRRAVGGIRRGAGSAASSLTGSGILEPLWSSLGSSSEVLTGLLKRLMRNYFKVILNQPFDAVRLLLQVGSFDLSSKFSPAAQNKSRATANDRGKKRLHKRKSSRVNNYLEDDDDDAGFFFSNGTDSKSEHRSRDGVAGASTDDERETDYEEDDDEEDDLYAPRGSPAPSKGSLQNHIQPLSLHTVDLMSSILSKEGTTSLWKATNVSYIIQALSSTLTSWFTGFFSPFLEIPDPFYIDMNYSPDPFKSLLLILVASVATGLILAPLDLIRTKFIVTKINPNSKNSRLKRSLRDNIKLLKSYFCPVQLIIPTFLNSFVNNFIKNVAPYVLTTKFQLNPSSAFYEFCKLAAEFIELLLKLPVETILRRAQTSYLTNKTQNEEVGDSNGLEINKNDLIVEFTGYTGAFDTIFNSIYHGKKQENPYNDNCGIASLYRGWRIGMLTIFARWGFRMTSSIDSKFVEERF